MITRRQRRSTTKLDDLDVKPEVLKRKQKSLGHRFSVWLFCWRRWILERPKLLSKVATAIVVFYLLFGGFVRLRLPSFLKSEPKQPQTKGSFAPLPDDQTFLPNVLYGCGDTARKVDEIQVHVIAWKRSLSLELLLSELKYAIYDDWNKDVPLYIHIDGDAHNETLGVVERFRWEHGPYIKDIRTENIGLRDMWLTSLNDAAEKAGNNTLMIVFEDDMRVSPSYFKYLLAVIDAYGRNPDCRDADLMGFSLSPMRLEELRKPFKRWDARAAMGKRFDNDNRHIAYLSVVPSSWGAAYWSDRWKEFARFAETRMAPPYYNKKEDKRKINPSDYHKLKLSPEEYWIPDSRSNVWPGSWKRFMVDFMYARGLVMLYPSLPKERGFATTLALSGSHTWGNSSLETYKNVNPRVADLVTHFGHLAELGILPRYGDLAVFDLHLTMSTKVKLAAQGADFLRQVKEKCRGCDDLLHEWARPGQNFTQVDRNGNSMICAPDLYMPAGAVYHRNAIAEPSQKKYLLFEPQYGTNNQLFSVVEAYFWAQALNRQLVLPPVFLPRTSAFGQHLSLDQILEQPAFRDGFDFLPGTSSLEKLVSNKKAWWYSKHKFASTAEPPIDFKDWVGKHHEVYRTLRLTRDAVFDDPTYFFAHTLNSEKPASQKLVNINLRSLFDKTRSIDEVRHLMGGCNDNVLFFQGMFFASISGLDPRKLMPKVLTLGNGVEGIFRSIKEQLSKEFGTDCYDCFHVRLGDFVSMCNQIELAKSDPNSILHKQVSHTIATSDTYSCTVTVEELSMAILSSGLPAFVMSDSSEQLSTQLRKLPIKTVTSEWVQRKVKEMLPTDVSLEELNLMSLIIEQQLCSKSKTAYLNRFSTVSQRIISLRNQKGFKYWTRDMTETLKKANKCTLRSCLGLSSS